MPNIIKHHCAVLGKPIAHSLSPVLHNAAYGTLGLDDGSIHVRRSTRGVLTRSFQVLTLLGPVSALPCR